MPAHPKFPLDFAGRVLVVAGSDSGGGAGIQGDIKTVTCLGGYAATAITALTAQNTQGVFAIHDVPPAFVREQIERVMEDIGADAFKTGIPKPLTTKDLTAAAGGVKPSTREWFSDARNYALYANDGGQYDDLAKYLKLR